MRQLLFLLVFCLLHCGVHAEQDNCPDPRSKSIERDLAQLVGGAVLYSTDISRFDSSVSCLLSMYSRQDVSIAGLKWDIAHSLLRVMAADPVEFFSVLSRKDEQSIRRWLESFDHAAAWPGDRCPKYDPLTMARRSIEDLRLSQLQSEALRKKVIAQLKKWPCRVSS